MNCSLYIKATTKAFLFSLFSFILVDLHAQIDQAKVAAFKASMIEKGNYQAEALDKVLASAEYDQTIIDKISKPAEGTMTWGRYRRIFIQPERIQAGVDFWNEHESTLNAVSEESGVPVEIILGIMGVETFFGQRIGSYRVLDALYTLAFGYPKRSKFFTSELEKFLELSQKENIDITSIKGSYAGAIGYAQFMPSSYLAYAKSFDDDGSRNLMEPKDAIASIANYLREHRWEKGAPITQEISNISNSNPSGSKSVKPANTLKYYSDQGYAPSGNLTPSLKASIVELEGEEGMEYWFGFFNFYVITRYNHSPLYAMAVYQLAQEIKYSRQE
ncbi:MAG: lytic murein transglycosylase B [Cyclobacteriaceae bacterium]